MLIQFLMFITLFSAHQLAGREEVNYARGQLRRIAKPEERFPGFLNNNFRKPGYALGIIVGLSNSTGGTSFLIL